METDLTVEKDPSSFFFLSFFFSDVELTVTIVNKTLKKAEKN